MEDVLTLRLPRELIRELERQAKSKGMKKSALARQALSQALRPTLPAPQRPYEKVRDLLERAEELGGEGVPLIAAEQQGAYVRAKVKERLARRR